ncbi:hypothetical protein [Saccharothrix sp. ALI-22-I]|uniref:hypothetical protein n=1 Tax=Saccharothrix sp. ALI-22-I TaxID=1933778 RepID=UPI0015C3702A|nr:hypothetical protein [Saccharothrix sp. ALI-22-I]
MDGERPLDPVGQRLRDIRPTHRREGVGQLGQPTDEVATAAGPLLTEGHIVRSQ